MTTVSNKERRTPETDTVLRDNRRWPRSPIGPCPDITALLDADGMVTYASPSITPALGYRPDEIVGRHARVLVHPEDVGTLERMLAELGRASGTGLSAEFRLRRKDGWWGRFEGSAANLLAVPGVAAVVCTFRDLAARKLAPRSGWDETEAPDHFVQFYETDGHLADAVGDFVGAGLAAGEACIVVATEAHRAAIETRLHVAGLEPAGAGARGDYFALDAAETLARFMVAGTPDAARFADVIGGVVARAAEGGRRVRIFGEMVALLWAEGNAPAAVRLEELWNELQGAPHAFSLFCAYPMSAVAGEEHVGPLTEICERHARVIPDESYSAVVGPGDRLRAIALLQQKARSLEAEIVERRAVQERLRVSETRYRRLFEASTDGILMLDPDTGAIADANPVVAALLGYPRGELLGRALWDVGVFADPEAAAPVLRELREHGVVRLETLELRTRDGHRRYVELVGNRFRTNGHDVIQCNMRDVTERRRLERRTRESLDALLAMAEILVSADAPPADAVVDDTPATRDDAARRGIQAVAQRLTELTRQVLGCERVSLTAVEPASGRAEPLAVVGLSPELERVWRGTTPALRADDYLDDASAARLQAGEPVVVEFALRRDPDRPDYGAERTLVAPMLLHGELVGTLSVGYGSTPHTYTPDEIALATAVAKLCTLVVERERLLQEREEARASALAFQEANRRMDEFLGVASHELKTPVTAIKMNLQVMGRRLDGLRQSAAAERPTGIADLETLVAGVRKGIGHSERGIARLMRIVDDLLDVSRIRAGKLELHSGPCDLAAVVRDTTEEQRQLHPERIVRLDLPADAERASVPVVADADRIGQVVTNYLTNALKYSAEDRPVDVQVRVRGDSAWVGVRDRGPGLTPEEQAHIWEPFHRVPRVTVASGSAIGLGLGLHICKTMVERQGGSVGVESAEGQGATFWFALPLDSGHTGERQATTPQG